MNLDRSKVPAVRRYKILRGLLVQSVHNIIEGDSVPTYEYTARDIQSTECGRYMISATGDRRFRKEPGRHKGRSEGEGVGHCSVDGVM